MSDVPTTLPTTLDITPSPRILSVFKDIEFPILNCFAELIDNSVDSFISMKRAGTPVTRPTVNVAISAAKVTIKDNGPGMSIETLRDALRAGWTSKSNQGDLGLYGMGFNIATARLGEKTTIWTTRAGETVWHGVTIDLKALRGADSFALEVRERVKTDPSASGTWIEIEDIRADWHRVLGQAAQTKSKITDRLARIYSSMLRDDNPYPIRFHLRVNEVAVQPWRGCVWPSDFTVLRRDLGDVSPYQEIDRSFGTRYLLKASGEVVDEVSGLSEDEYEVITQRVRGWLGIQRYADPNEYGIDIIRNGRVIELENKDLFSWTDEDGRTVVEYPVDDLRLGGRIVGEIHLDHGYVYYTKTKFEREHASWKHLLLAVRDNEPLSNREDRGFGREPNRSPLGVLFRGFRRLLPQGNRPARENLAIKDNNRAKQWAKEWRRGLMPAADDLFWRQMLDQQDAPVETPGHSDPNEPDVINQPGVTTPTGGGADILTPGGGTAPTAVPTGGEDTAAAELVVATPEPLSRLPDLSGEARGVGPSGRAFKYATYADPSEPRPIEGQLSPADGYRITVNPSHPVFQSASFQVKDAVLAQLAYFVVSEEKAWSRSPDDVSYGAILAELRAKILPSDSIETNRLKLDIGALRDRLVQTMHVRLDRARQQDLLGHLDEGARSRVNMRAALAGEAGAPMLFLEPGDLEHLAISCPEALFGGVLFSDEWRPGGVDDAAALAGYQRALVSSVARPLGVIGDFLAFPSRADTRERGVFVRAALVELQRRLAAP